MTNFIIPVGIPACGKSTYCKELEQLGYIIHSSDAIREEFDLFGNENNSKVFEIMNKRVISDLKNGKNVVYDATNLVRKRRIALLEMVKNIPCQKICKLFIVPVSVCKERNANRTGTAKVPESVYDRMLCSFNVPMLSEGFDTIDIIRNSEGDKPIDLNALDTFEQDNPYHSVTLGKHQKLAVEHLKLMNCTNDNIITATKYHDIGKIYTKSFTNRNGEPTKTAHFYGHENYGAYIFLTQSKNLNLSDNTALYVAQLINWHMAPLNRWKGTTPIPKDKKLLSDDFIKDILLLHNADIVAH